MWEMYLLWSYICLHEIHVFDPLLLVLLANYLVINIIMFVVSHNSSFLSLLSSYPRWLRQMSVISVNRDHHN